MAAGVGRSDSRTIEGAHADADRRGSPDVRHMARRSAARARADARRSHRQQGRVRTCRLGSARRAQSRAGIRFIRHAPSAAGARHRRRAERRVARVSGGSRHRVAHRPRRSRRPRDRDRPRAGRTIDACLRSHRRRHAAGARREGRRDAVPVFRHRDRERVGFHWNSRVGSVEGPHARACGVPRRVLVRLEDVPPATDVARR